MGVGLQAFYDPRSYLIGLRLALESASDKNEQGVVGHGGDEEQSEQEEDDTRLAQGVWSSCANKIL